MLKNIIKSCLVAAMAVSMAAPAMADVTVAGCLRAALVQSAVKDGASTMDMNSDARINVSGMKEVGAWTASAFTEIETDSADAISQRDRWVKIENESMSVKFGKQYVHGTEADTCFYHTGDQIADLFWVGEYFGARNDFLNISLKGVGINFWVGLNEKSDGADSDATDDSLDNENYTQTDIGVFYGGSFGAVDLSLMYASVTKKVDEKNAGVVGGPEDGYAGSEIGVGVGYNISDAMAVGFNFSVVSDKDGNADDATKINFVELNFSMGLDDTSGIFVSYGTKSEKVGSGDAFNDTNMILQYNTQVGSATVYAVYGSRKEGAVLSADEITTTNMGVGAKYDF